MQAELREYPSFPYDDFDDSLQQVKSIISRGVYYPDRIGHTYEEMVTFYELAAGGYGRASGFTVQFGLSSGGSAVIIGMGLRECGKDYATPLVAIDPYLSVETGYEIESQRVAKDNIQRLGLSDLVCPITFTAAEFVDTFWDKPVRLAVIDTIHSYEQTKQETDCILPYMIRDSWLVVHGYHPASIGCVEAINELIDRLEISEVFRVYNRADLQADNEFCLIHESSLIMMRLNKET